MKGRYTMVQMKDIVKYVFREHKFKAICASGNKYDCTYCPEYKTMFFVIPENEKILGYELADETEKSKMITKNVWYVNNVLNLVSTEETVTIRDQNFKVLVCGSKREEKFKEFWYTEVESFTWQNDGMLYIDITTKK